MGGLLIGLSTFQGEFDFGVPQFRMVFHPLLRRLRRRLRADRRAPVDRPRRRDLRRPLLPAHPRLASRLLVGPVFGEVDARRWRCTSPRRSWSSSPPSRCIKRPLAFGAVAGVLAGTLGMAAEWGWTQRRLPPAVDDRHPARGRSILAVVAGVAGGTFGALLGTGLRGELVSRTRPRPPRWRCWRIAACVANGLVTDNATDGQGRRQRQRRAHRRPTSPTAPPGRPPPPGRARRELHVERLERVGPGHYRLGPRRPPTDGTWKAMIRVQPRPRDPQRAGPPARRRGDPGQGRPADDRAARVRRRQARGPPARAEGRRRRRR